MDLTPIFIHLEKHIVEITQSKNERSFPAQKRLLLCKNLGSSKIAMFPNLLRTKFKSYVPHNMQLRNRGDQFVK